MAEVVKTVSSGVIEGALALARMVMVVFSTAESSSPSSNATACMFKAPVWDSSMESPFDTQSPSVALGTR